MSGQLETYSSGLLQAAQQAEIQAYKQRETAAGWCLLLSVSEASRKGAQSRKEAG